MLLSEAKNILKKNGYRIICENDKEDVITSIDFLLSEMGYELDEINYILEEYENIINAYADKMSAEDILSMIMDRYMFDEYKKKLRDELLSRGLSHDEINDLMANKQKEIERLLNGNFHTIKHIADVVLK